MGSSPLPNRRDGLPRDRDGTTVHNVRLDKSFFTEDDLPCNSSRQALFTRILKVYIELYAQEEIGANKLKSMKGENTTAVSISFH